MQIVICGKNKNGMAKTEKELKEMRVDAFSFACDLSKSSDIKKFFNFTVNNFKNIDILVNNAGVACYKNFKDNTEEEINQTIDVNLRGLILTTKYFLPKINRRGLIINISSGAGKRGYGGLAVYCASKFAVIGFTESLAQELDEIKTVSICPGGVDTQMYYGMFGEHPGLKPEHIAGKIVDICTCPKKIKSGSAIKIYRATDALNYLKLKYFRTT